MLTPSDSSAPPVRAVLSRRVKPPPDLHLLRWGMWLYLVLWVFEGALRKWIVPGLANPLLVIRDPLLLAMYAFAFRKAVFPTNLLVFVIAGLGGVAMLVSVIATDTPLTVELYGLRADYLHLPLIFLIPVVFGRRELQEVGKWALVLALPMSALVLWQFLSRSTAWINLGASTGEGQSYMIGSAFGHIRPSGTFSFNNGVNEFTNLALAYFLWHLLVKRVYPRLLWVATIPALLLMILLSGSRGALGAVLIILAATLFISLVQPRYLRSAFALGALAAVCFVIVGAFAVFKQGIDVFSSRFGNAEHVRTGFVDRFFTTYLSALDYIPVSKEWGVGLGMGTNVASGLRSEGRRSFLLTEGEGGRIILENGPTVGVAYLALRWVLGLYLGVLSLRALLRDSNPLPMLLFSTCINNILIGTFGQPTELGFTTIAGGLCLAAARAGGSLPLAPDEAREAGEAAPVPAAESSPRERRRVRVVRPAVVAPPVPPTPARLPRGRSAIAQRLHEESSEE